jgi:hypothetical protein
MKEVEPINVARRQIITRAMPVCALSCLGLGKAAASAAPSFQPAKHPFDAKVEDITYRQFYASIFGDVIRMGKALEQELGKDKAIAFLKQVTTEMMTEYGQKQAQKSSDHSFRAWGDTFRTFDTWKDRMIYEIVEDTDQALELKVKECIFAETFFKASAGDIGFAFICYGDYAWPRAFNPKIKMIRDKTLMQGHDCCNHRYVLET